ncbi:MAG: alpha-N-acetylglucosaminidase [Alistipes sp.]|nr:alpha-N-acetylglucosaminidase [Alistipes sp.]
MQALLKRVLPEHQQHFVIKQLPNKGEDYFTLSSKNGKIVIGGNTANSMAVGLNHYLRYYCNVSIGWFVDDKYEMPDKLPAIEGEVCIKARCKDRFFLNYCTYGYTMPWWKWREWEHFIDWMALQGVNMPLSITGQESVWYRVWRKLGLSDEEVRNYFTGPAHLPWHRMNNIDYWQGGVPMSWLDSQEALQKQIVARERELNMRPVLPAFAGHVPQELKRIYPDAKMDKLACWAGYSAPYSPTLLDTSDPLYAKIQKLFIEEQTALYGTDHIYGLDVFNEMEPPSWEPEYLARISQQVYESLRKADKNAEWLQMSWLFYHKREQWTPERIEAYLKGAPLSKQVLLDYYCDRQEVWRMTDKFYGAPYIWCYLGNFGGNTNLAGDLRDAHNKIEAALKEGGENLAGVGSTLEGFDCSPFKFEYIFEKAWDMPQHQDLNVWMCHLADRHLGYKDERAHKAWLLLNDKVYNFAGHTTQATIANARPSMDRRLNRTNKRVLNRYPNSVLIEAIGLLLECESSKEVYAYDLVNLVRQMLGNLYNDLFVEYKAAMEQYDRKRMGELEAKMMAIHADLEELLSSRTDFLMGKWIADARAFGVNEAEKLYYEQNARCLLTTWGERDAELNDYANRMWAGLMAGYYGKRWQMFFDAVNDAFDAGEKFDEVQQKALHNRITAFEESWWRNCIGDYNSIPKGDPLEIVKRVYLKYKQ